MNWGPILFLVGILGFWIFNEVVVLPNQIRPGLSTLDLIYLDTPSYFGLIYTGVSFLFMVIFLKGSIMLISDYEREGRPLP